MTAPQLPPVSVWATGQTSHRAQLLDGYLPESAAHPARMLPAVARQAITTYTRPGDLVVDPMCGIGTTLVEAVRLGRDAVGIELQPRWSDLARRNLAVAHRRRVSGEAEVITGDAGQIASITSRLDRLAALVLTSLPYGVFVHGRVTTTGDRAGMTKWNDQYLLDRRHPMDFARLRQDRFLAAMTEILTACRAALAPGGVVVLTARPWRRGDHLIDLPGLLTRAAEAAGLVLIDRVAALLARLDDDRVELHALFVEMANVRAGRQRGLPVSVIAHEDVLVFRYDQ